jgi:hypothetical protein
MRTEALGAWSFMGICQAVPAEQMKSDLDDITYCT